MESGVSLSAREVIAAFLSGLCLYLQDSRDPNPVPRRYRLALSALAALSVLLPPLVRGRQPVKTDWHPGRELLMRAAALSTALSFEWARRVAQRPRQL